ncbi:MAG: RNA polymerase sigma factor [Chloroflexi bacterium]|nr:RNA polymerase sigma factor [Chloroflexota bacterium]
MNSEEPSRLISDCLAGDERAIDMLVRRYEADVFRLAYSIVEDASDASEATQETFIAVLKALKTYQEKTSFKAWLYTITLNVSRSHLRKRKILERLRTTITSIFLVDSQTQNLPEDTIIQNETESAIWNSLNKLDERHKIVVVLRYFHDLSVAEISEILSVNEGTIHSRLHTAREKLRNTLSYLHHGE